MKKYLMGVLVLCSLTACHAQNTTSKENQETKTTENVSKDKSDSKAETTKQEKETTSEAKSQSDEVSLANNGSYSYVQGKYTTIPIINKKHPLAPSYNPGEDPEALAHFQKLQGDMISLGYNVSTAYSGFRSYEYQAQVYQNYVARDGQLAADNYSARPGYSEHQSGLAFDFFDLSGNLLVDSAATTWLAMHAHEYGFIVRYIADKESITGYQAETWHVRYVGKEATDIYESGLTLEEYFGVEGGDYEE